jgi:hypothetical protein
MNTDNIIAARETYRAATVKFVDDNFHLFKLNDKLPSFKEMCAYIESTRDRRVNVSKSERRWFIERLPTILRHEYSNYDELVRQCQPRNAETVLLIWRRRK